MEPIASFSGLASGIQWRDMIDQIMRLEASRRLTPVTQRVQLQEKRQSAWTDFSGRVAKLRDASAAFAGGSAFGVFKTTASESASGRALVSATTSSTASPGSYEIEVLSLASAEKLGSAAVADASAALNLSGTFHVNGRAVTLDAGDSLTALRDKINAANNGTGASGVTATILSTSATSHRLILTADATGSRGIELVDSGSGVLRSATLGILGGAQVSNTSPTDPSRTESQRFGSSSLTLEAALGVSPPPAVTTLEIDGRRITVDFATDTLLTLQNKVVSAGGSAEIVSDTVGGKTSHRLSVGGAVQADPAATDPANSQRVAELLGFVKSAAAERISEGTDAKFKVDGYTLTRRSNNVTDAIEGVTLDLLASDAASRTSSVSGAGLAIRVDPKSIGAGAYAVALSDDGAGTVTGATIGGVAAQWDGATRTIRGAAGTPFEGLELAYNGSATSGTVGDLVVEGDISVRLTIERDAEKTVEKVKEFVDAYNEIVSFVGNQRDAKGALAGDGSLRAMQSSLRDALFAPLSGLSETNPLTRLSLAGVEFTRDGTLSLDSDVLTNALATNPADVKELFAEFGALMEGEADRIADEYTGSVKLHTDALGVAIASLKDRELNVQALLERQREGLVKQFTAMEEAMSRLQSQGSWLAAQLSSLPI